MIPVVILIEKIKDRLLHTGGQDVRRWAGQVHFKVTGVTGVKVTVLAEHGDSMESHCLVLS